MTQHVDFYFDFVSPAAYLAYKRLQQMQRDYDLIAAVKTTARPL